MPKPEFEFFDPQHDKSAWKPVPGDVTGSLAELLLAEDPISGDYTRLLRFPPWADTSANGTLTHDFWEEVWIIEGSIHDLRLGETFHAGMYACRPPGMPHGPWTSEAGAVTFEIRYYRHEADGSADG